MANCGEDCENKGEEVALALAELSVARDDMQPRVSGFEVRRLGARAAALNALRPELGVIDQLHQELVVDGPVSGGPLSDLAEVALNSSRTV